MKRITVILLCILLCVCMVGCTANTSSLMGYSPTAPTVCTPETDSKEEQSDTTNSHNESSETTGASTESTPETTESSHTGKENTPTVSGPSSTTEPDNTSGDKQPNASTGERKNETSTTTGSKNPTEETKPQETKPEETKPKEETKTPEESKPTEPPKATEPEAPADPYAYPFNISQIRQDCIAQAKSYGFTLDESLTSNNSSWSGAETANANTQGTRLKRFLGELVEYYSPAYRESMGLPEANITAFNIYFEALGNNNYRIYFLFLL